MIADAVVRSQLGSAPDLRYPPSRSHQQEPPIVKELWKLALERVSDKLEDPAHDKQRDRNTPESRYEGNDQQQSQRDDDQRNADGMANAVHCIPMATRILRDPVGPGSSEEHLCPAPLRRAALQAAFYEADVPG